MKVKHANKPIMSDYTYNLLHERGIENVDFFLNPDETALQSYEDLENIDKGISLIKSITPETKIGVVVDCDVDGYTSAAIIVTYLQRLFPDFYPDEEQQHIKFYIHEAKSHGLEEHWEQILDDGINFLIVPDAGSNDTNYARELPIPILILDHHIVDEEPAPNMFIINNQSSPKYKNKSLSGAGVTFQFCRALDKAFEKNYSDDLIDLAALGVCADMMSGLEVENQYLWKKGFSNIKNQFIAALVRRAEYSIAGTRDLPDDELYQYLNPTTIAFYVVPMINAMIRVGSMVDKEKTFIAFIDGNRSVMSTKRGEMGVPVSIATECARLCANAKELQKRIEERAVNEIEGKIIENGLLDNKILFIVLDEEKYPSTLNGLIAMQLSQKYHRPTIIVRANDQGMVKGSIRGLSNTELSSFKDYLESTELFEYVRGHDNAAGCSLPEKKVDVFLEKSNEDLAKFDFNSGCYEINFERDARDSDILDLIEDIGQYKNIWSQRNNEPEIYIKNLNITPADIRVMGKNANVLSINKDGISYKKFFATDLINRINAMEGTCTLDIIGKALTNQWGKQLIIDHYEIHDDSLEF